MELSQVLPKIIFPAEGALGYRLLGTDVKFMLLPVSSRWEWGITK
jgi:hypothetical protein